MQTKNSPPRPCCPCRKGRFGGSAVDILSALVGIGLLCFGGWWIFKTVGQAGHEYAEGMISAQNQSTELVCQMNLRSIWQGLQLALSADGSYPTSREALVHWVGDARVFRCPDPNGGDYRYLPPARTNSSTVSLLVYEPNAVHNGRHGVLLSNGRIGLVLPEELAGMLPESRRKPR